MKFIINKGGTASSEETEIPLNEIPPIIYHYCSMESFSAIVQSKNIWLSNSYVLNDSREKTWINNFMDNAFSNFKTDSNKNFLKRVIELFNMNNFSPYVACFSSDGDVLSQWRAYASDATGVAIGFDPKSFGIKFRPPYTGATLEHTLGLISVVYDENIQKEITESILPNAFNSYKGGKIDEDNAVIFAAYSFRKFCPIFKNPAFKEESEWRIIHTPLILGDKQENITLMSACSSINFRVSLNRLVAHFCLPIEVSDSRQPIMNIVLGPKNIADESLIQLMLNNHGFKQVHIHRSKASYR